MRGPVGDQRRAHAEHRIGVEIVILIAEDVCDQPFVSRRFDLEMQMGGAPRMPPERLQHPADRPVMRDGVGYCQDRAEVELAFGVGPQPRACLVVRRVGTLDIVKAFVIRLPDGQLRAGHGFAVEPMHAAGHEARNAVRAVCNIAAVVDQGRVLDIERAEYGGLRAPLRFAVVQGRDQRGQSEGIGQQDELLPLVVAHLPGFRQEPDALEPFLFG
ncbi:hypothetical protein D3C72_1491260 [compost metagenome]